MQCDSLQRPNPLVYGSVCSGIEAATAAWHPLGWKPAFFSEIEAFPRAVLQHHYPSIPCHGDFTTIKENDYAAIDLLVGGTPCQAFSVAGLRKGFADERGNLTLEFVRLAQRLKPRWVVWENVPGVLSIDRGRAFGSFLGGLAECGYGFAYRVLDAQYFGIPQRRRRVFVVGYLGDWRPAAAVLFERESLLRDLTPSREKGKGVTHDVAPSLTSSGQGVERTGESSGQDPVIPCWWDGGQISQTLDAVLSKGQAMPEKNRFPAVLQPIAASTSGAGYWREEIGALRGREQDSHENLVTHSLRGEGFDASEDGTGRGTPLVPVVGPDVLKTLQENGCGHLGMQPVAIQERAVCENPDAGLDGAGFRTDGMAYTLEARSVPQAVAFSCKDYGADVGNTAPTLRAMGHDGSHANAGGQLAVAYDMRGRDGGAMMEGPHPTVNIRAASGGSSRSFVSAPMQVRRITPRECERLQGFPDNYTLVPNRGKPAADGPRYKALGNSMAVPCMRFIGERIQMVIELQEILTKAA